MMTSQTESHGSGVQHQTSPDQPSPTPPRGMRDWFRAAGLAVTLAVVAAGLGVGAVKLGTVYLGKQPDGSFIVSSGQRIEPGTIAFSGRPIDLAISPAGDVVAVLHKREVFLINATTREVIADSNRPLNASAAFRGIAWSPDGSLLVASTDQGFLKLFRRDRDTKTLKEDGVIRLVADGEKNPVPGGMAFTKDGQTLFVAAVNRNAVVELDVAQRVVAREHPVQNLPFEVRLSEDEQTLVVSNWGGRFAREGERVQLSDQIPILIDERGAAASGTISLVDRSGGPTRHIEVDLHPSSIAVKGDRAFVACALSDTVVEVDLTKGEVVRRLPITYANLKVAGSMPNALAIRGDTLYICNGGDNAVAELDLTTSAIRGFRPVGYFPTAIELTADGRFAYVLNTKGNGSVARTLLGQAGNAHDFQGTVSVLDLSEDLATETKKVVAHNRWKTPLSVPPLKVYQGAIEHVIYIIKENRTYDEVFGDLPQGNGDPKLCSLGETVMPNHRKLAREFTLFDNGYVSGTNSADGHQWSTQGLANDYLERFYVGYSRSYSDDGADPMVFSGAGAIWDAALRKNKTLRVYGEFCDDEKNRVVPEPKDWFEVWEDRQQQTGKFRFEAVTNIPSLQPHIHPNYMYWPLWQSDQHRADLFIEDYQRLSAENRVPNLMILSLPCDHAEGTNPRYPTPRAMMADNDLALGRIVEAVSKSPQWAKTCILVIEDDAQSGPDHVDGHRTVFMAISPYVKRQFVDSSFYTTVSMLRTIELMLGLDPMNRFDALADPLNLCFTDTPNLTPYQAVPANIPLDERNPSGADMTEADRYWLEKTLSLDWSKMDRADPYWLNRINWYSIHKGKIPYPDRPGDAPGQFDDPEEEAEIIRPNQVGISDDD